MPSHGAGDEEHRRRPRPVHRLRQLHRGVPRQDTAHSPDGELRPHLRLLRRRPRVRQGLPRGTVGLPLPGEAGGIELVQALREEA